MRILSWNIENLTLTRVYDPSGATQLAQADNLDRSTSNMLYIAETVWQADPDVFVVIEPRCGQTHNVGRLAAGGGVDALVHILAWLRQISPNWMLVPPVVVNPIAYDDHNLQADVTRSETVGVFWRDDRVRFAGPWVWPAAAAATGPAIPPGGAAAGTYPQGYDGALVPANTTAAARVEWRDGNGQLVLFPYANDRRPLQVRFVERNAPGRTADIVAMHPSPARAQQMLVPLADALARDCNPGNNAFTVVVGDINVNLLGTGILEQDALTSMEGRSATPYGRVPPNPVVPTMLRRTTGNGAATPAVYMKTSCLDYGWVRYGTNARVVAPSTVVANRVSGTAATATIPAFTHHMSAPLATFGAMGDATARNAAFRERANYGHIGPPGVGTSDHMPIVMAV